MIRKVLCDIGVINGELRIFDVIGEGAGMRTTERADCSSFLARKDHSIPALINTLRRRWK